MPSAKRVLLVDDDQMLRHSLAEQLAAEGEYAPVEAGTCAQARERAGEGLYEFIILDVGLPDGDGRVLCSELRDRGISCPIIMLTAADSDMDTIEGRMLTRCKSRDRGEGWGACYRPVAAGETVVCRFRFRPRFESGNYLLSIGVAADNSGELSPLDRRYDSILVKIENREPGYGLVGIGASCELVHAAVAA